MNMAGEKKRDALVPKRRQRKYSYDEGLDEPAKLIGDEPAEIERAAPADESEPTEWIEVGIPPETPAFGERKCESQTPAAFSASKHGGAEAREQSTSSFNIY